MDNESGFRSGGTVPSYNFNQFRSVSNFDIKHFLAMSSIYELPFARMWSSGPKRLTRGWMLFPVITMQSGFPLDITAGLSRSATRPGPSGVGDGSLVRANLVSPVTFYSPETYQKGPNGRTGNFYFDPTAFSNTALVALNTTSNNGLTNPSAATYGTLGRNSIRGPSLVNANLAISKVTDLFHESVKLEIRGEFFNLLNHAEFNNPSTSITSGSFGQVSGTADPRIIQVAARFTF
jgi:hypothetical protein